MLYLADINYAFHCSSGYSCTPHNYYFPTSQSLDTIKIINLDLHSKFSEKLTGTFEQGCQHLYVSLLCFFVVLNKEGIITWSIFASWFFNRTLSIYNYILSAPYNLCYRIRLSDLFMFLLYGLVYYSHVSYSDLH